jgi:drug/metabolite transporter (DMT)-like permease
MRIKADLTLLLVALVWGLAFIAQRTAATEVGALIFNAARWLLAALIMLPFLKFRIPLRNGAFRWMLLAGILLFLESYFQQAGLETTTAGNAGFITGIYVVLIPILLSIFWKERIPALIWLAVIVTAGGIYMLSMGGPIRLNKGDLLELVGAFMIALHVIVTGKAVKNTPVLPFVVGQFLVCGLLNLIFGLIFQADSIPGLLPHWISILYLAAIATCVGFTLQAYGQQHAPPADAAVILSMESVFAAVFGWIILREQLTWIQISGCVLILAAIIFSQVLVMKQNKQVTPDSILQ